MLRETLQYLTTPCPPHIRKIGYLSESIATAARYKRYKKAWKQHLDNTKSFITLKTNSLTRKRKVLILGSGNFYDIPLDLLAQEFENIICTDVIFLRQAKQKIKKYGIKSTLCDITGITKNIYNNPHNIPTSSPIFFLEDNEIDLVISANILSQLPLIPKQWLLNNTTHNEETLMSFSKHIIEAHIDYLKKFSGKVCLITDTHYEIYDKNKTLLDSSNALYETSLPKIETGWNWEIIPASNLPSRNKIQHKIAALSM